MSSYDYDPSQLAGSGSGFHAYHSQPNPVHLSNASASTSSQTFQRAASEAASHASSQPAPSSRSSSKPRCFECGTHRMRVRRGQLICKYGHVQQHFRVEHAFDDEYEQFQRSTGRRKLTREKSIRTWTSTRSGLSAQISTDEEPEEEEGDDDDDDDGEDLESATDLEGSAVGGRPRKRRRTRRKKRRRRQTYSLNNRAGIGTNSLLQGRFKRLQCLQLILRMQIEELNRFFKGKLPPEAELIARELWAMFVASLPVSLFPPVPLTAATYDYRMRMGLDEDVEQVETATGTERLYNAAEDQELETRLAALDKAKRRQRRRRYSEVGPEAQSDTEARTSGTEGWTDEEQIDRDMADPEETLASLDPVFAEERREARRRARSAGEASAVQGIQAGPAKAVGSESDQGGAAPHSEEDELVDESETRDDDGHDGDERHSSGTDAPSGANGPGRRPAYRGRFLHAQSVRQLKNLAHFVSLPTTLAILYLTLVKLQIPILWSDLTDLIGSYRLTFLDAVQRLPADLVHLLNSDDLRLAQLTLNSIPPVSILHLRAVQLADLLKQNFDVSFEETSASPTLWRLVDGMGLPPTIYCATKRLLSFLGVSMHVSLFAAPEADREAEGRDLPSRGDVRARLRLLGEDRHPLPREFVMMAAILVVVKMRFGLDWDDRTETIAFPPSTLPEEDDELRGAGGGRDTAGSVSGTPSLRRWVEALVEIGEERSRQTDTVHEVYRSADVLDMSTQQIDAYLLFLETNLAQTNHPLLFNWRRPRELEDLLSFNRFIPRDAEAAPPTDADPTATTDPHATRSATEDDYHHRILSGVYREVVPPRQSASEGRIEPGDRYNMYQLTMDPAGTLPVEIHTTYMKILEAANRVLGIRPPSYVPSLRWRYRIGAAQLRASESEMGIQAVLEQVEDLLVRTLASRRGEAKTKHSKQAAERMQEGDSTAAET